MERCAEHVNIEDVDAADSRASECALEGGDACDGHGRFWQTFLMYRSICPNPDEGSRAICTGRAARYLPD